MGLSWIADDIDPASVPGSLPHPKRTRDQDGPAVTGGKASHRAPRRPPPPALVLAARIATLASSRLIAGYLSGAPARRGSFRRYWV